MGKIKHGESLTSSPTAGQTSRFWLHIALQYDLEDESIMTVDNGEDQAWRVSGRPKFKSLHYWSEEIINTSSDTWRLTEQHAAVVQHVAEVLKHGTLVLATGAAEVAQEPAAHHHHLRCSILHKQHKCFTGQLRCTVATLSLSYRLPRQIQHPLLHTALLLLFCQRGSMLFTTHNSSPPPPQHKYLPFVYEELIQL